MNIRNIFLSLALAAATTGMACDSGDDGSGTDTNNSTGETNDSDSDATTEGPGTDTENPSACAIDGTPVFAGVGEGSSVVNGPFQEVSWAADSIACGSDCAAEPYVLLQIIEGNRAPGTYQVGIDVKVSVNTCSGDPVSITDGTIEIMTNDEGCFSAVISGASVTEGHDVNGALWAAVCS